MIPWWSILLLLYLSVIFAEYKRLPKSVLPINYDLNLTVFVEGYELGNNTFKGSVAIQLNIIETVDRIIIHSSGLNFTKEDCHLTSENNNKMKVTKILYDLESEQAILILNSTLRKGTKSMLFVKYRGSISNDMVGIYGANSDEKSVIATQFEAIYAHRMVPCFNEPWMKATWKLDITHPSGTTALSNTMENPHRPHDTFQTTSFPPTPIMSPYLVALTISEYQFKSDWSKSGTLVRIFASSDFLERTAHAMKAAIKSLDKFETMFKINYPLEKLDFFFVEKHSSGAMENWGLVILQESLLTQKNERVLPRTIAHEVVHQWFGNLVTMEWFDDLWLNEGFASFYDMDEVYDHFNEVDTRYLRQHAYQYLNEKPIRKSISQKKDFIVDGIVTHSKPSFLIKKLWKLMGEKKFTEKISLYLRKNLYKSVNSSVFYEYFAEALPAGSPSIRVYLEPWLEQVGHPLVVLKKHNATHDRVIQQRFDNGALATYDETVPAPKWNYSWNIPIWYRTSSHEDKFIWLRQGKSIFIEKNSTIAADELFSVKYHDCQFFKRYRCILNSFEYTTLGFQSFSDLKILLNNTNFTKKEKTEFIRPFTLMLSLSSLKLVDSDYYFSGNRDFEVDFKFFNETSRSHEIILFLKNRVYPVAQYPEISKILIRNFELVSTDDDVLYEMAKFAEGDDKMRIEKLCNNMNSTIVYKQLKMLSTWRQKNTKKVFEVLDILRIDIKKI